MTVNFQQLRIIRETARQNFNLTDVANALFMSQSGVSKHIRELEDELGVELFIRRGKRLLGLTEPGRELLAIVERMLLDANNIRQAAKQFSNREEGSLTIATTHTQARYALPPVVMQFKKQFPKVHLILLQATPAEIAVLLQEGRADIGIATESLENAANLAHFPFYTWSHIAIAPEGHPLAAKAFITLEDIAAYPLVTYDKNITGRAVIDEAFSKAGITPDIVMSARDSDVIKTYVELGLGVGIVASMAYNPQRDAGLRMLDCAHLFAANTALIAVRYGHYLRGYAYHFIELCSARLTEAAIRSQLSRAEQTETGDA